MIIEIREEEMVSVPRQVLQDLIWNCRVGPGCGALEQSRRQYTCLIKDDSRCRVALQTG